MGERWPPLEVPDSDLVRDPCGWTMSGVEEERRPSGTVPEAPGAGATVTTQRMQGWSVLVCVCVWGVRVGATTSPSDLSSPFPPGSSKRPGLTSVSLFILWERQ